MSKIYPVLLAGGSGSRLWPLSRRSYPKQFSDLLGSHTLFQGSALRLTSSAIIEFGQHITVTNSDFRFIVSEQLISVGIDPGPILIEPEAKNTAPAILAASLYAIAKDPEAVLLVAPSDHVIPDTDCFHSSVSLGLDRVLAGEIITFGITPTRPETGYGYLQLAAEPGDAVGIKKITKFVEKPDITTAEIMVDSGNYLWNAGIFMFKAADMVSAFEKISPDTLKFVRSALKAGVADLGFFRLDSSFWAQLDDISIDYLIMEKISNLAAVPFSGQWSDLGDWKAVWSESKPDHQGVVASSGAHAIDCSNALLRSESPGQQIVGLGVKDLIAISMPDAVLVADMNRAQEVRGVVELLKSSKVSQAEVYPKDYRPWGWFESLAIGERFQVKRICVNPGASLSLQSHEFRSEHWIVVQGVAKVTVNKEVKELVEGASIYIPRQAIHRMENPGETIMVLVEVQTGTYFGEDDITRYEDIYARSSAD